MATGYGKHFKPDETEQTEKAREDQIQNSAGGFVWKTANWMRLDRFLVLGAEGGSYYASERKLTKENAKTIVSLIKEDGVGVVNHVLEVSNEGRAYKNDPALFVLALCFAEGNQETKDAAHDALPKVARIGTHLFAFVEYATSLRGWGRALKRAVSDWYRIKDAEGLNYQLSKYRQRGGWSQRDVVRLTHPKPESPEKNQSYQYAVGKLTNFDEATSYLQAVNKVKTANNYEIAKLIREHNLPREVLPTEALKDKEVWAALFERMPMTAMIRNTATMTTVGLLEPMNDNTKEFIRRVNDSEVLKKARIHPIQVLAALLTYSSGQGARGSKTWTPVQSIVDGLDKSFYQTFKTVVPTGKRIMLAVDVSGSMGMGTICGVPNMTPRHGAAAMALTIANTESDYAIYGFGTTFKELNISPKQSLDQAMKNMSLPFQGTDCALPMLHAIEKKMEIDAFVVITDNETWAGKMHPFEALKTYRKKFNIPAKLVTVGMVSNGFTIADPNDAGMLDVVGFDTNAPVVIADFIR